MVEINRIIVETHNLKTICSVCEDSLLYQNMNAIGGVPGYGKTIALETFQREYPQNIVMVNVLTSMSPSLFYSSIYNELSSQKYENRLPLYLAIKRAANLFNNQGKNMLLIIDEATKFNHNFFQHLHDFRDLTKATTGIIIAGGHYFKRKFGKWSEKVENGMPEFFSRINNWIELDPPTFDEIVAIIRANDIHDNGFEKRCMKLDDFRQLEHEIDNYNKLKSKIVEAKLKRTSS